MKFAQASLLAACLPAITARYIDNTLQDDVILYPQDVQEPEFLIELSPGEVRWVTEEEKWELRRVRPNDFNPESSTR